MPAMRARAIHGSNFLRSTTISSMNERRAAAPAQAASLKIERKSGNVEAQKYEADRTHACVMPFWG
jgi:hypothetical protein